MTFTPRKAAAVAVAAALAVSGATGVANAQSLGSNEDSTGSLAAYGLSPDSGSLLQPANANGNGSLDTEGYLIGEPTTGSLAGSLSEAIASSGVNSLSRSRHWLGRHHGFRVHRGAHHPLTGPGLCPRRGLARN